jgi:hypothetical protein
MKIKFQVLLAFCIISMSTKAQNWYPKNTKWTFDSPELLPTYMAHGYTEYKVVEDTIINDTTAKLITVDRVSYSGNRFYKKDSLFVHEANSKVYFWNGSRFKLMYDFTLEVGDTLDVGIDLGSCDSVSAIIVDSISTINLNGHDLQVQYISYTMFAESQYGSTETINEKIIERIGIEEQEGLIYTRKCLLDEKFNLTGLRCYSDDDISYKSTWWTNYFYGADCDSLINGITANIHKTESGEFLVYPNPSNDFVTISTKNTDDFYIELYNSSGIKLSKTDLSKTTIIDLHKYQPGLYLIKIYQNLTEVYAYKIIKK